jgi:plasmid stabilization system protein ParE
VVLSVVVLSVPSSGCSSKSKRRWRYHSLSKTAQLALPENLQASDTDERREAVTRLAERRDVEREEIFSVLDAVARTDPVVQIRCIAIRGLARYEDDRPVATFLKILQANETTEQSLANTPEIRWEALKGLLALEAEGVLNEQQRELVCDICMELAESAESRNVRIAATKALGRFHQERVFMPLIRNLRAEDFAIAEQAELSLINLTGVTHQFDPQAWQTWLDSVDDPFAKAGQHPEIERPKGPGWWEKQKRAFRRAIKLNAE